MTLKLSLLRLCVQACNSAHGRLTPASLLSMVPQRAVCSVHREHARKCAACIWPLFVHAPTHKKMKTPAEQ